MVRARQKRQSLTNDEIRRLILQYFYDRNRNATSEFGKKGSAVNISTAKKDLRDLYSLTQQEVMSNLIYLLSQGWITKKKLQRQVLTKTGTLIPSGTNYYQITAAGIDKIEGAGEFTMPKFHGINIQATGQNIITLGDGNQINAQFSELGTALVELRYAITRSDAPEDVKMSLVADIDTIQSQLAKRDPNKSIVAAAWETVKAAATINGCAALVQKGSDLISRLLS